MGCSYHVVIQQDVLNGIAVFSVTLLSASA